MVERRPRGRPQVRCDDDTRHLIVEASAQEFQANGYAATNMTAVAQRAGISTKTLYRLVPTKADLFASVVEDRIQRFLLATDHEIVHGQELSAGLERILCAFGTLTLSAEVIAINRLVIGESERFPEIAKTFYRSAVVPVNTIIEGWLRAPGRSGQAADRRHPRRLRHAARHDELRAAAHRHAAPATGARRSGD